MTPAEMSEKLRRFDEQENMRIRNALEEHDLKSQRKIAQLKEKHQLAVSVRPVRSVCLVECLQFGDRRRSYFGRPLRKIRW